MKYTFEPKNKQPLYNSYQLDELRGMTLMQLRDICELESIIHAAMDRQDREELIQLIMTFRGSREKKLISGYNEEGMERIQEELNSVAIMELPPGNLAVPSKISVFEGIGTGYFDDYRIGRQPDLDMVNAFVLDPNNKICAVLRVVSFPGHPDDLFLARLAEMPCDQGSVHDYRLLLCPQKLSDEITAIYNEGGSSLPRVIQAYLAPLLEFEVCTPEKAHVPLAIDFGTSNSAAGIYLNRAYFNKIQHHIKPGLLRPDCVNYVPFLAPDGAVMPMLSTAIGVKEVRGDNSVIWQYGFAAEEMMSQGYLGQGVCVFFDIKRWVADFNEEETLADSSGRQIRSARKYIIKAYLDYIIHSAEQRFKCKFEKLFFSYPVKQRERFISMYRELFTDYELVEEDMFDEGIAVLYSIISSFIDSNSYIENTDYHALILDCGGGTTDQSSASFRIRRGRAAFEIDISTAYENGDTDFGGNNLTFRIMQLLKIEAARKLIGGDTGMSDLIGRFSSDQYREVDEQGREAIYKELAAAYERAEAVLPTRYREYEYSGREEYYKVYNNFFHLFNLAERIKKAFFENSQILRIEISSEKAATLPDTVFIHAQRWKLAMRVPGGRLAVQKTFPRISMNTHQVWILFQADIYDIFRRFVGRLYQQKQLSQYQIVKLTGQSCKIGLFRDCLKEFVPGSLIRQGQSRQTDPYQLKLTCLDGAIRFLRDKTMGLAYVNINYGRPALPYILSAYTHFGEKVTLIHSLDRERVFGSVSRHHPSTEVELTLSDERGREKFVYSITSRLEEFRHVTYEEIEELYREQIPQAEVDLIENGEVRYFVWADAGQWGFNLAPISRRDDELYLAPQKMYSFENESWMVNYFDGRH